MNQLDNFRTITDKFESQFTIIVYDLTIKNLISELYKKLSFIKQIKDTFKKKYINDKLYSLIEYLNEMDGDLIANNIYLVGCDINTINLTRD